MNSETVAQLLARQGVTRAQLTLFARTASGLIYRSDDAAVHWQDPSLRPLVLRSTPGGDQGTYLEGLDGQGVVVRTLHVLPTSPSAGGVDICGYPISEPLSGNGQVVQYFQNARLEYPPKGYSP